MEGFGSCFEGNINSFLMRSWGGVRQREEARGTPKFDTHIWRLHGFLWVVMPAPWICVP